MPRFERRCKGAGGILLYQNLVVMADQWIGKPEGSKPQSVIGKFGRSKELF